MPQADSAPFTVRAAALALAALALAVLIGWQFDLPALKSVLPGLATMKANTALGFLLCGGVLWLAVSDRGDVAACLLRQWAPVFLAAIGSLTLLEYVADLNLGRSITLSRRGAAQPGRAWPHVRDHGG